jgi:hypothetical protein
MEQILKQNIYDHGGSRIWLESKDGEKRDLMADTYGNKELALRVKVCVEEYLKEKGELI